MMKALATVAIMAALVMPGAAKEAAGVPVGSDHGNMVGHNNKMKNGHANKPMVVAPEKRIHNDVPDVPEDMDASAQGGAHAHSAE
jgi:hypothetical protein